MSVRKYNAKTAKKGVGKKRSRSASTYRTAEKALMGGPNARAQKLWFDTYGTGADIGVGVANYFINRSLNLIPANSGSNGRRGGHIRVLNLNMHGRLYADNGSLSSFQLEQARIRLRFIVYYDKCNNGSSDRVTPALLLSGLPMPPDVGSTVKVDSFRNIPEASDFKILHDKIITLEPQAGVGFQASGSSTVMYPVTRSRDFRISKKLNLDVDFDSDAASGITEGNIRNGNFGFMVFTDGTELGTTTKMDYVCRLKYSTNWPWN